jgi:hypothetical protein
VARADKIEVVGLRDLQKALRAADSALPRELTKTHKALAEKVVERAKGAASGNRQAARFLVPALSAGGEQRNAFVKIDGSRNAPALGAEFGSFKFHQFQPWRGNQYTDPLAQDVGYFLHPTLRKMRSEIEDTYEQLIEDLVLRIAKK